MSRQLSVRVPDEMYQQFSDLALRRRLSLQRYMLGALDWLLRSTNIAELFEGGGWDGLEKNHRLTRAEDEFDNQPAKCASMRAVAGGREEIKDPSDLSSTPNSTVVDTPTNPPSDYPPEFLEFWGVYPTRAGNRNKRGALTAYLRAVKKSNPALILAGAKQYAKYMKAINRVGTPYVMLATTFLNQGAWEEDWTPPPPTARGERYQRNWQEDIPLPPHVSERMKPRG